MKTYQYKPCINCGRNVVHVDGGKRRCFSCDYDQGFPDERESQRKVAQNAPDPLMNSIGAPPYRLTPGCHEWDNEQQ